MAQETCCACGIVFSIPDIRLSELKATGDTFYCPNGHKLHFKVGKSEEDKLRERIGVLREEVEHLRYHLGFEKRSAAALRGVITKMKRKRDESAENMLQALEAGARHIRIPALKAGMLNAAEHERGRIRD